MWSKLQGIGRAVAAGATLLCVSTVLTQALLAGVLWGRGYLTLEKCARIQALLAGVDQQEIRKQEWQQLQQSAADPEKAATNQVTEMRRVALERMSGNVALSESRLREASRRFELQEEVFATKVANLEVEVLRNTRRQLLQLLINMESDQAKEHLVRMIDDRGMDDVLRVVGEMTKPEQAKVFGAFQTDAEQQVLNDLLRRMRLDTGEL